MGGDHETRTLAPAWESAGKRVLLIELHDGQRRLPDSARGSIEQLEAGLVTVDGYEQLGFRDRAWLKPVSQR